MGLLPHGLAWHDAGLDATSNPPQVEKLCDVLVVRGGSAGAAAAGASASRPSDKNNHNPPPAEGARSYFRLPPRPPSCAALFPVVHEGSEEL